MSVRMPVLFLSHGSASATVGGDELSACWGQIAPRLPRPAAILMVSAHWTTRLPMLSAGQLPGTIHDFDEGTAELCSHRYPAPGDPALALRIKKMLSGAGIAAGLDATHGLDHGAWAPLLSLFPGAGLPVIQLSVQPERCARHHFALGRALAALPDESILVVALGRMAHHHNDHLQATGSLPIPESPTFREWVHAQLLEGGDSAIEALFDWERQAPGGRASHPTAEHFLPLFVSLGASGTEFRAESLDGGRGGDALAADGYLFARAE